MLTFIIGLLAGAASPTQASVNARIREDLKSPYTTSIYNFIAAGLIIAVLILVTERNLYIPLGTIAREPFWIWLGGSCGTAIVMLNIICLPKLGSAKNVMLICFGQIMTGLIIDHFGLFYSPEASMSVIRLIGAILVIIGIALVNGIKPGKGSDDGSDTGSTSSQGGSVILYVLLAIFCGFACAAQVGINGALNKYAGSALKATLISMVVALITAVIVTGLVILIKGMNGIYDGENPEGKKKFRLWMISGGAIAIVIVGGNAVAAPILGTGIVTILNLIGMMAAGLLIDATGFLGIEKKPVTLAKTTGMLLMIAGAAVISLL